MQQDEFRTLKGYQRRSPYDLTESMEDYVEMIARCGNQAGSARINQLAANLHVRPSSASKMMAKLKAADIVEFEKYGVVVLTAKGRMAGRYLLWRHEVLSRFFCRLNRSESELTQVEQIEHFINEETVRNLEKLLSVFPDIDER